MTTFLGDSNADRHMDTNRSTTWGSRKIFIQYMYFRIVLPSLLFLHIIVIPYFTNTQSVLSLGHSLGMKFFLSPPQALGSALVHY